MGLLSIIENNSLANKWDMLYEGIKSIGFSRLKAAAKDVDKDKQEEAKAIREEVKNGLRSSRTTLFPIARRSY